MHVLLLTMHVLLLTMHVLLLTMHATFPRHGDTIDADWKGGQGARLSNGLGCGLSTVGCRLWERRTFSLSWVWRFSASERGLALATDV